MYLLSMTIMVAIQSNNAFFLVFEIPAYLRWYKPFRSLSLEYAVILNTLYIMFVVKWRQTAAEGEDPPAD